MLDRLNPFTAFQRSISAKVFLLTAGCIFATIFSISWLNSRRLATFLSQDAESNASVAISTAANSISGILDYWSALAAAAAHNVAAFEGEDSFHFLQNFVESNAEIVAIGLGGGDGKSGGVRIVMSQVDKADRFEPFGRNQVRSFLGEFARKWSESLEAREGNGRTVEIADLSSATGLPLLGLAVRFQPHGETNPIRLFLTVWSERLLAAMPDPAVGRSYLVDKKGEVAVARAKDLLGKPAPLEDTPVAELAAVGAASTVVRSFETPEGMRLGGVSQLDRWNLTLVLVKDTESTRQAIRSILIKSATWTWLLSLVFLFLAHLGAKQVTRRMVEVTASTKRIARGEFDAAPTFRSSDEVGELADAVSDMSRQIQSLLTIRVENARKEQELETARLVQSTMFPKSLSPGRYLSIAGECTPATECGGDWWSHYRAPNGDDYVVIADATGHGAGAAMVTAMAFATCQSLFNALERDPTKTLSPSQILQDLNTTLWQAGLGKTTMTAFVGLIPKDRREIRFAGAAHPFPFILPRAADDARLGRAGNRRHLSLQGNGSILGMESDFQVSDGSRPLRAGDRIFLYTDGLTEEVNDTGEAFGMRRFRRAIRADGHAVDDIKKQVLAAAADFRAQVPLDDDITVVVIGVDSPEIIELAS